MHLRAFKPLECSGCPLFAQSRLSDLIVCRQSKPSDQHTAITHKQQCWSLYPVEQRPQVGKLIENGVDRMQGEIIYGVAVCTLYKKFPVNKDVLAA